MKRICERNQYDTVSYRIDRDRIVCYVLDTTTLDLIKFANQPVRTKGL